jgi:hypothetical protein
LSNFPHTEADVVRYLSQVFRGDVRSDETTHYFTVRGLGSGQEFPFLRKQLLEIFASLNEKEIGDETALHTFNSYEIIVNEENSFPGHRLRGNPIQVGDTTSALSYEVSSVSDEYLIWLICTASVNNFLNDLGIYMISSYVQRFVSEQSSKTITALEILKKLSSRLTTLKIKSLNKQNLQQFQVITHSFLFHIAYNLDFAFVPQRFFEEISRRGRINRIRRSGINDEIDPPRRTYNEYLVNHYILAISTDSPTVQFLSHYHVIEHFFESIINDDLIEQIKTSITQPGFSYKRKKDVDQLISTVKKTLKIRSESITYNERNALKLSLTKFVDISQLILELEKYDSAIINYYSTIEVSFSKAPTVAFRSGDEKRIIDELTQRIYATRNALVHSKEGDKARYTPFRDERALVKEIPLMRFISEIVILAVSEVV